VIARDRHWWIDAHLSQKTPLTAIDRPAARGLLLPQGLNPREVVRIMTRTIGAALGVVVILLFFATLAVEHHRFFDTAPSNTIAARR
jgi:hypothetical protein